MHSVRGRGIRPVREAHVKGLAVVGESKVGYIYSKALEKHLGGVFNSPKNYFL